MITLPITAFMAIFFLCAALSFVLGWEQSVARWRERDQKLHNAVATLEAQLADLNRRMTEDPLRAASERGSMIILSQIETLVRRLRENLP